MGDGEMEIGGLIFLEKQKSHFLKSLRVLYVDDCRQLVSLVAQGVEEDDDTNRDTDISGEEEEEEEEEEKRGKLQYLGLPCGLERLTLWKCDKLEKLPSDMHNLTSLRSLVIRNCKRLSCLPEMGFLLEVLSIGGCESLTCLSSYSMWGNGVPLPHSLKALHIRRCQNLESLVSAAFTSADSFPSLESLHIVDCPQLKSLPECIHRRLKDLGIRGCQNLGELPISVHHLPALEDLSIDGWPAGLLSIQQGGPNPNLRNLDIEGVARDEQLFSVPLPSSLTTLRISKFKNLSPEAFQNLTSLQKLHIRDCPALTSIPDQWLPPSLLSLGIWDCPLLTSIPYQLLPPSLCSLGISGCPLLAPHFAKGKGRYWPKVKFIPEVEIDKKCNGSDSTQRAFEGCITGGIFA